MSTSLDMIEAGPHGCLYAVVGDPNPIARLDDPRHAERIAACVRACAGIPTCELEFRRFVQADVGLHSYHLERDET